MVNWMDVLHTDILVKLCSDFYSPEEIKVAKRILHDYFYKNEEEKPRLRIRKGENMKVANLQDMLNLLLSLQLAEVPDFLARNLNNLPPLSLKDFDLSKLLTEMEMLKTEVCVIKTIIADQADIRREVATLKSNNAASQAERDRRPAEPSAPNAEQTEVNDNGEFAGNQGETVVEVVKAFQHHPSYAAVLSQPARIANREATEQPSLQRGREDATAHNIRSAAQAIGGATLQSARHANEWTTVEASGRKV